MPASARFSVRGIGVADRVSTSTSRRSCLSRSLAATPKRCSSSTTTRPRSLNGTSLLSRRCVPITMSTVPSARPSIVAACSLAETNRESSADLQRERREALAERRVVLGGEDRRRHEDRDLLAVLGRLERGAQRDLGLAVADVADDEPVHRPRRSMSALTSATARSWSMVSSYGNDASISGLPRRVVAKAWPWAPARAAYSARSSSARSATALRTRCFARSHSVPPSLQSCGRSPPA